MHYNDWKMKIESMLWYLNKSTFPPILCFNSFSFWMSTWRTSQRSDAISWNGSLYLGWFSQKASLFNTFYWVSFGCVFFSFFFFFFHLLKCDSPSKLPCLTSSRCFFKDKTKLTTVTLNWIWCREEKKREEKRVTLYLQKV